MTMRAILSIALLGIIGNTTASHAGEFRHRAPHFIGYGFQEGAAGVNGLPVHIRGIGTFAGGIAATRIHGNGVYISVSQGIALTGEASPAPKVKIINVSENPERNACAMEHGVCVIRAGQ
jgi:hypothetical protein